MQLQTLILHCVVPSKTKFYIPKVYEKEKLKIIVYQQKDNFSNKETDFWEGTKKFWICQNY